MFMFLKSIGASGGKSDIEVFPYIQCINEKILTTLYPLSSKLNNFVIVQYEESALDTRLCAMKCQCTCRMIYHDKATFVASQDTLVEIIAQA